MSVSDMSAVRVTFYSLLITTNAFVGSGYLQDSKNADRLTVLYSYNKADADVSSRHISNEDSKNDYYLKSRPQTADRHQGSGTLNQYYVRNDPGKHNHQDDEIRSTESGNNNQHSYIKQQRHSTKATNENNNEYGDTRYGYGIDNTKKSTGNSYGRNMMLHNGSGDDDTKTNISYRNEKNRHTPVIEKEEGTTNKYNSQHRSDNWNDILTNGNDNNYNTKEESSSKENVYVNEVTAENGSSSQHTPANKNYYWSRRPQTADRHQENNTADADELSQHISNEESKNYLRNRPQIADRHQERGTLNKHYFQSGNDPGKDYNQDDEIRSTKSGNNNQQSYIKQERHSNENNSGYGDTQYGYGKENTEKSTGNAYSTNVVLHNVSGDDDTKKNTSHRDEKNYNRYTPVVEKKEGTLNKNVGNFNVNINLQNSLKLTDNSSQDTDSSAAPKPKGTSDKYNVIPSQSATTSYENISIEDEDSDQSNTNLKNNDERPYLEDLRRAYFERINYNNNEYNSKRKPEHNDNKYNERNDNRDNQLYRNNYNKYGDHHKYRSSQDSSYQYNKNGNRYNTRYSDHKNNKYNGNNYKKYDNEHYNHNSHHGHKYNDIRVKNYYRNDNKRYNRGNYEEKENKHSGKRGHKYSDEEDDIKYNVDKEYHHRGWGQSYRDQTKKKDYSRRSNHSEKKNQCRYLCSLRSGVKDVFNYFSR